MPNRFVTYVVDIALIAADVTNDVIILTGFWKMSFAPEFTPYSVSCKNCATFILAVTLPNVNLFSNFYC